LRQWTDFFAVDRELDASAFGRHTDPGALTGASQCDVLHGFVTIADLDRLIRSRLVARGGNFHEMGSGGQIHHAAR